MVRIQYTATSVQLKIDAARIASTQVGKAALSRHKPIRNWSGWAGQVARDVCFKAAMGLSSLGLGGAAVSERKAEGGSSRMLRLIRRLERLGLRMRWQMAGMLGTFSTARPVQPRVFTL
jgi:hypothetical protein